MPRKSGTKINPKGLKKIAGELLGFGIVFTLVGGFMGSILLSARSGAIKKERIQQVETLRTLENEHNSFTLTDAHEVTTTVGDNVFSLNYQFGIVTIESPNETTSNYLFHQFGDVAVIDQARQAGLEIAQSILTLDETVEASEHADLADHDIYSDTVSDARAFQTLYTDWSYASGQDNLTADSEAVPETKEQDATDQTPNQAEEPGTSDNKQDETAFATPAPLAIQSKSLTV